MTESAPANAVATPQTQSISGEHLPQSSGGGPSEDAKHAPQPDVAAATDLAGDEAAGDDLHAVEAKPLNDKDWIRSRTSRLLGLVDEDDENAPTTSFRDEPDDRPTDETKAKLVQGAQQPTPPPEHRYQEIDVDGDDDVLVATTDEANQVQLDEVRSSRRLFLRNLPYTATEADLLKLFEAFGTIQEVSLSHTMWTPTCNTSLVV